MSVRFFLDVLEREVLGWFRFRAQTVVTVVKIGMHPGWLRRALATLLKPFDVS